MKTPIELFGIECRKGWEKLYKPLYEKVLAEGGKVIQVKEKFGGLRFYADNISKELRKEIDEAEEASYTICEDCGEPGKLRGDGWLMTLCDEHYQESRRK